MRTLPEAVKKGLQKGLESFWLVVIEAGGGKRYYWPTPAKNKEGYSLILKETEMDEQLEYDLTMISEQTGWRIESSIDLYKGVLVANDSIAEIEIANRDLFFKSFATGRTLKNRPVFISLGFIPEGQNPTVVIEQEMLRKFTGTIEECKDFGGKLVLVCNERQNFDVFVISAKGEMNTKSFHEWAGGERVTLAIVFTDVVGSTALGEEIKDEAMNEVRRAHFDQNRKLIDRFKGREIKTIGDSFMAAFKSVDGALDYTLALQRNTGHPQVKIRAGIHIGSMQVEESDVFSNTVNFTDRVLKAIKDAEIWLSDRAKEDIDRLGAERYKHLNWERHDGVAMKGFPDVFTLWSLR